MLSLLLPAPRFLDPDLLQSGNAGLSFDEARAQFGGWAIAAAPLLIGADLVSGIDEATLSILTAPEVLAVDQDALGVQGVRVSAAAPGGSECWARPLADGRVAAMLVNRAITPADVVCTFAELGLRRPAAPAAVRDLWARAELGNATGSFVAKALAGHASMLVSFTQ